MRWGRAGAFVWLGFLPGAGNRSQDFCLLGKTEVRRGHTPGKNRVRARNGEEKDRVRVLLTAAARACEARRRKRQGARLARRSRAGDEASCADDPAPGGFCPAGFLPAAGNRRQAFSLPGKTEARRRRAPGMNRVRARRGEEKTRCATCSPQVRAFSLPGKTGAVRGLAPRKNRVRARLKCSHKHGARLAHRRCACVRDAGKKRHGARIAHRRCRSPARARTWKRPCACEARRRKRQGARLARRSRAGDEASCADDPAPGGFCPAGFLPAAGNRRQAFSLPGKTGARRGPAPGNNRVRARRGEEKDMVRDLLGAAARIAHRRCAGAQGSRGKGEL